MNNEPHDIYWWAERASQGLVHWRVSDDDEERWYVGESSANAVRFLSLGMFTPLPEVVVEVSSSGNVWEPLRGKQTASKARAKAFLFNAARYALIVRHDLGPPDEEELFDAFLSYRTDEAELAERVAVALRSAGVRVWYDKWHVPRTREMPLEYYIRHGLKRSSVIVRLWIEHPIPFVPPILNEDRWVWYELGLGTMGIPANLIRFSPDWLNSTFSQRIPELVSELRESYSYDEIVRRVWHDEDSTLFVWGGRNKSASTRGKRVP